jgi:equilibrative nucleoside transporter 1/2/3
LDLATSGKGGLGTFIGVCTISGIFGIADAYTQGGMIGDLSYMLPEFMQVSITNLSSMGTDTKNHKDTDIII